MTLDRIEFPPAVESPPYRKSERCHTIYEDPVYLNAVESTECERKGLLLDCSVGTWHQRQQERRGSERTKVMHARLDRRSVHGEESVIFSGSIGVELDSEGFIVSTCTEQ